MSEGAFKSWSESFDGDTQLWLLEQSGEVRLLMSRPPPNNDPLYDPRVYHVWRGDKWYYCGNNYNEAIAEYERLCERGKKDP